MTYFATGGFLSRTTVINRCAPPIRVFILPTFRTRIAVMRVPCMRLLSPVFGAGRSVKAILIQSPGRVLSRASAISS